MGLFSPLKKLPMRVHARLLKLDFCKWYFSAIFTQPDQIELFLLVLSNKFLINGYKYSGTLFLGSSYHYLLKNIAHVRGICKFYPSCIFVFVFVYLCMRHLVISVLISLDQELSQNLWFVWFKTSYSGVVTDAGRTDK